MVKRSELNKAVGHLKRRDSTIARLIEIEGKCRFDEAQHDASFAALTRSIVFQQLSSKAATTIYKRFVATLGRRQPNPRSILDADPEALRAAGLSRQKAAYIIDLAAKMDSGALSLRRLRFLDDEAVIDKLTQVKGVGRWTAQMFLMFHLGRLDVHLEHPGQPWASRDTQVEEGKVVNRFLGTDIELAPHIGQNATMEQMVQTFKRRTRFVAIDEPDEFVPSDRYLTADTCGACHPDQYDAWAESGHARAYATLEKTGDEFRYDCIPCHVLGYGETFIDAHKPAANKNVQCESCHGTNPKHPTNPKRHSWKTVDEKACWGCHNPEVTRAEFTPSTMVPMVACPPLARDPEQGK